VLRGAWLAPGAHVNAVGACFAASRELDTEAVCRARLFTDCRESGERATFMPKAEGAIGDDHIRAELGEVLAGRPWPGLGGGGDGVRRWAWRWRMYVRAPHPRAGCAIGADLGRAKECCH
jgi:hypothetical protein